VGWPSSAARPHLGASHTARKTANLRAGLGSVQGLLVPRHSDDQHQGPDSYVISIAESALSTLEAPPIGPRGLGLNILAACPSPKQSRRLAVSLGKGLPAHSFLLMSCVFRPRSQLCPLRTGNPAFGGIVGSLARVEDRNRALGRPASMNPQPQLTPLE
jgi:hypothetical protein